MSVDTVNPTIIRATFTGGAAYGPVSVPGVKAGDVVFASKNFQSLFEAFASADDQIEQIANVDYSTVQITLYLMRGV
jgi:hypothetical protein